LFNSLKSLIFQALPLCSFFIFIFCQKSTCFFSLYCVYLSHKEVVNFLLLSVNFSSNIKKEDLHMEPGGIVIVALFAVLLVVGIASGRKKAKKDQDGDNTTP